MAAADGVVVSKCNSNSTREVQQLCLKLLQQTETVMTIVFPAVMTIVFPALAATATTVVAVVAMFEVAVVDIGLLCNS